MSCKDIYQLDVNDLGHKIRLRRQELGMSLDELAARVQSDKSAISLIENGFRAPRYDTFLKIADALGIPGYPYPPRIRRATKHRCPKESAGNSKALIPGA